MRKRQILSEKYDIAPDRLWTTLKEVLDAADGLTLVSADDAEHKARFRSGVTWTSWGQNMEAVVDVEQSTSSRLMISSQVHSTFCSTRWGEKIHESKILGPITRSIKPALGESH